ncbi:hypothetical protein BDR06DRAFT_776485 [Suillus hirtellus]|nr:hypothetical protein BDR06DRAFT_776485 [Suillus hirtellus]
MQIGFGLPPLDVKANQHHKDGNSSETSFSSPALSGFIFDELPSVPPLWAPALASNVRSRKYSGIGSRNVLERHRDASYMSGTPISLEKIDSLRFCEFLSPRPTARCWIFFYQMRIPNLAEVCLETFNGDLLFYSTCEPHPDTTPRSRCVKKKERPTG